MNETKSVSQAMREGAAKTPYVSGHLWRYDDNLNMQTCALGAIVVGAGYHPGKMSFHTVFPELLLFATCPVCSELHSNRGGIIAHLNNQPGEHGDEAAHGWAREDIAWWYEQTFEQPGQGTRGGGMREFYDAIDELLRHDPLAYYIKQMQLLEPQLPQFTAERKEPPSMSTGLVRVATLPKPTVIEKPGLDEQLANDAAAKLGYGPMAEEIQAKTAEARLLATLRELDIRPFTHASVAAYKAEKRNEVQRESRWVFATWRATELSKYKKAVPSYVLHTALRVHDKMPDAKFMVDELVVETRTPDPFLFVQIGTKTRYYLDVWDEPSFKGERQF